MDYLLHTVTAMSSVASASSKDSKASGKRRDRVQSLVIRDDERAQLTEVIKERPLLKDLLELLLEEKDPNFKTIVC